MNWFKLVSLHDGGTLDRFDDEPAARTAFAQWVKDDPSAAEDVALIRKLGNVNECLMWEDVNEEA